jgi:HTH-type transcriptional regulator, transcriptional repressor of NAD biosynthesis genes
MSDIKRFRRGLVVGKFCPLHLGHESVISRAANCCEDVVVISYTKPGFPGYERERRAAWLAARFPDAVRLVLDDRHLVALCRDKGLGKAPAIPPDDAPDDAHRHFVAWLCTALLGQTVDAVFTSEAYGNGFAAALAGSFAHPVEHVCVDPARAALPVSGTQIRSDPHRWRRYLSREVYADFVRRICVLGGESTGKTTLAAALAKALDTCWVPEYGRELWEAKNGALVFDDMLHVALTQVKREEAAAGQANRALICDTSPLTTQFYSDAMFGQVAPELRRMACRPYDLLLLCAPDFEFVQDGTRRDEAFRLRQHRWYCDQLAAAGIEPVAIGGTHEQRLRLAMARVAALG